MSDEIKVCNKENGSFSQLWGRNCWVADSMLSLMLSHIDLLYEQSESEQADKALKNLEAYCKELRQKNREEYWPETVGDLPQIGEVKE